MMDRIVELCVNQMGIEKPPILHTPRDAKESFVNGDLVRIGIDGIEARYAGTFFDRSDDREYSCRVVRRVGDMIETKKFYFENGFFHLRSSGLHEEGTKRHHSWNEWLKRYGDSD